MILSSLGMLDHRKDRGVWFWRMCEEDKDGVGGLGKVGHPREPEANQLMKQKRKGKRTSKQKTKIIAGFVVQGKRDLNLWTDFLVSQVDK